MSTSGDEKEPGWGSLFLLMLGKEALAAVNKWRASKRTPPTPKRTPPTPKHTPLSVFHPPPAPIEALGLPWPCLRTEIEKAYKDRSRVHHPDRPGGSHEAFCALGVTYEAALLLCDLWVDFAAQKLRSASAAELAGYVDSGLLSTIDASNELNRRWWQAVYRNEGEV
jgi:hypothetical protein